MMSSRFPLNLSLKGILVSFTIATFLFLDGVLRSGSTNPPNLFGYSFLGLFVFVTWWLYRIIKRKGLAKSPLTLPFTMFIIVLVISTAMSVNQRKSLDSLFAYIAIVFLFFLLSDLIISGLDVRILETSILIYVTLLLIQGMLFIFVWYWAWYELKVPQYPIFLLRFRLFGVTSHPNVLTFLLNISLPFAIIRLYKAKIKYIRIFWFVWLFFMVIVLYFANSRGGIIATSFVVLMTLSWILISNGGTIKGNLKQWLFLNKYILTTSVFYICIFFILAITVNIISQYTGFLQHGGGFSGGRFSFWNVSFKLIRSYPFFGSGPGTYPQFYVIDYPSGINGWISPHAHNLYIDTAGQIGLLGEVILFWMIGATLYVLYSRSKINGFDFISFISSIKPRFIASFAALIGFLIHSLFDVPIPYPHAAIPLIFIIVIFLSTSKSIADGKKLKTIIPHVFIIIALFPLISMTFFRIYKAQIYQTASIQSALEDNWSNSNQYLIVAEDLDPTLSFYDLQRGFALGHLSFQEEKENQLDLLDEAIGAFKNAVNKHPYWAPYLLNLAFLLEKTGNYTEAISYLESIPQKWFEVWPLSSLYIAQSYQAIGDLKTAEFYYQTSVEQRPWVRDLVGCRANKICHDIPANNTNENYIYQIHNEAKFFMLDGNFESALQKLNGIPIESSPPIIWIDRAKAHMELGDFPSARYELKISESLGALNHLETRSYFVITVSEYYGSQDQLDKAISYLLLVAKPAKMYNNFYFYMYQRIGFPDHLFPEIKIMESNIYDSEIYYELSRIYAEQGNLREAEWAKSKAEVILNKLN